MLGSLLLTLSVALTALAGPVPPKPGQVEPGHESIFFVPVKVQDAGLCVDDSAAGNLGEAVWASQCKGDFGSWIWKPLEDGYYHLTLLGMDRCVGFDLRSEYDKRWRQATSSPGTGHGGVEVRSGPRCRNIGARS